jgi:hypothetical protein
MKAKAALGTVVGVGALLVATEGAATLTRPTVRITAVTSPGIYTGGPLDLQVAVESGAAAPRSAVLSLDYGGGTATQTLALPATATSVVKTAKLTDPGGLTSGCSPRSYVVRLTTPGDRANDQSFTIDVTPSCTFTSSIVDEWNMIEPDRVDEAKKDSVYLQNAAIETPPTCTAGPRIKAQIVNHSKLSSPSLIVQAKDGAVVKAQTSAAFALAAGSYKELVLTPVGAHDPAAKEVVVITDWTHGLGTHVDHHGITVTTKRSCTVAVAFATVRTVVR